MSQTNELLIANVRSSLVAQPSAKTGKMLEIVPSRLGSDAALIGAGVPFLNKLLTEQIESAQRRLKLNVREEE